MKGKVKSLLINIGLIVLTVLLGSWGISYLVKLNNQEIQCCKICDLTPNPKE